MTEASRTKVLFLITKGVPGGAQRYVFDLATHLPLGVYNPVVAFGEGTELGDMLDQAGVRTIRLAGLQRDVSIGKEFRTFFSLIKIIREEKPDILHLNSSKAGFLGVIAGRVAGVPRIIFTAHNWAFNYDINPLAKKIYKIAHWLTIFLSHATIAVAQKIAHDMDALPLIRDKIAVVYNGVGEVELESKTKVRTLLAPQIHEGVWIGTISELHKNKGIDSALEAFARLVPKYAHIAFIVIGGAGSASTNETEALAKLAENLGIAGKVHFMGHIPDASLLMKAFDILTLTSRSEALPYALLEAGRAEMAVVASSVGGIPEIIRDRKSGLLVEAKNIPEITDALEYLIEHPEKRAKFGKELSRTVAKKFSIDKMVKETITVYNNG